MSFCAFLLIFICKKIKLLICQPCISSSQHANALKCVYCYFLCVNLQGEKGSPGPVGPPVSTVLTLYLIMNETSTSDLTFVVNPVKYVSQN